MSGKAGNVILPIIVIILAVVVAYLVIAQPQIFASKQSALAIQLTDPPTVPQGTQQLLVAYSSVEVHAEAANSMNQSGWVSATGSGTINLLALTNVSQTIANARVAANSTINLVRFNVTSAKIMINGTIYNVTVPNGQINVAITGDQKMNSSSSGVLIDFHPMVNSHGGANAAAYMMVPAASAIVVNPNASVSIDTNVGSTAQIGAGLRLRLGLGTGTGGGVCIGVNGQSCGSATTTVGQGSNSSEMGREVTVGAGGRISNFVVQGVDYSNGTVDGLLYTMYPVASDVGVNTTLHINGKVGYRCDNTQAILTSVNANNTATFTTIVNSSANVGGCPI